MNSVAGYANGSIAVFVVDPTDVTKKQTFTGVVDTAGVQLTSVVWTAGTNQSHSGGATVVDYATATHISMITKGLLVQHTQAGAHGAVTATSLAATGNVSSSAGTINAATVSSLQDTSIALSTYRNEAQTAFTASGGVWTGDSYAGTKAASMTAWVGYINGQRGTISAVTARVFTASKDTYVDVLNTAGAFTLVYTEVANNAASPALAANSLRLAIVVTGATTIAAAGSINQGDPTCILPIASSIAYSVTDSLGNLICNRTPSPTILGYRQITAAVTTTSTTVVAATGLSVPVIVPTGRRVKITTYSPHVRVGTANKTSQVEIWDGTVGSGTRLNFAVNITIIAINGSAMICETVTLPATASKTYNVGFISDTGGGVTTTFDAGATAPAYVLVELV